MMGERQAAEDLAQEAFLKLWRSATSYRADRGGVRTWLLSIVHNRGIDQLRSLASRRRTQEKIEASAPKSQPSEAFAESWRNSQREQVREALTAVFIKVDRAANSQHGQSSLPHPQALPHIALRLSPPPVLRGCGPPLYALCPLSC